MITNVSLKLKNTVLYKDASFSFTPGLHIIYGLNKTTKNSLNGNAAGKTFLFSQVPEILNNAPVAGARTDRVTTGTRELTFDIGQSTYEIQRQGNRVKLVENGKPIATTERALTEQLAKLLGYTEDEILSFVYLGDKGSNHPLLAKSESERKRFFSSFFQLDKIDEEKKVIQAAARKLSYVPALLKDKKEQLKRIPKHKGNKKLKATLDKLVKEKAKLDKEQLSYAGVRQAEQFRNNNKRELDFLDSLGVPTNNKKELRSYLNKHKAKVKSLKDEIKLAEQYEKQKQEYLKYKEEAEGIPKLAQGVLSKDRANVVKYAARYDLLISRIEKARSKYKEVAKPEKLVRNPNFDVEELRDELRLTSSILRHIDEGNCPTCGSEFKSSRAKVEKKQKTLQRRLKRQEQYEEQQQELKIYKQQKRINDNSKEQVRKYKNLIKKYAPYKLAIRYIDVAIVEKPKPYKHELVKLKEQYRRHRRAVQAIDLIGRNFSLVNTKGKGKDLAKNIAQVNEKIHKARTELEIRRIDAKERKGLIAEIDKLQEKDKRRQDIETLLKAYDNKAVKQMIIDQISTTFVSTLNSYANKVFREDFSFNFSWENRSSLTVTRRHKGKLTTTPIDKLSGAEISLFLGALALTLRRFKPKEKRLPFLIWDEPAASMSEETFGTFKEFLKTVREEIGSVVILTPKASELYEDATAYTVVKEKGESKLMLGHPTEKLHDT